MLKARYYGLVQSAFFDKVEMAVSRLGTSGPSINILIKLMTIVSLVFAPVFVHFGGILF